MMCVCNRPIYLYQFRWFSFWKTKNWIYRHLTVPLIFFFELNSDWADSGFTELTSNLFLNQETLELDWSYLRFKVESVQAAARKQGQSDLCEQYPSLSCSHHWRCWLEETRLCPRICSEAALCWRRWIDLDWILHPGSTQGDISILGKGYINNFMWNQLQEIKEN